jgi:hypothetical protein
MWVLITKYEPPVPPQPQLPEHLLHLDVAYNNKGQRDIDDYLGNYDDILISYCPLLMDPQVNDFNWVHRAMRSTLFRCSE